MAVRERLDTSLRKLDLLTMECISSFLENDKVQSEPTAEPKIIDALLSTLGIAVTRDELVLYLAARLSRIIAVGRDEIRNYDSHLREIVRIADIDPKELQLAVLLRTIRDRWNPETKVLLWETPDGIQPYNPNSLLRVLDKTHPEAAEFLRSLMGEAEVVADREHAAPVSAVVAA